MPFDFNYSEAVDILMITVTGPTNVEMYKQSIHHILSSDQYSPEVDTIWDLRKLDFSNIDKSVLNQLVLFRQGNNSDRGNACIAIVADSDLAFGMSRMYQALSSDLSQEMAVFKSFEDARNWLLGKKTEEFGSNKSL